MHCTALGKAVLAHLPADRVQEILGRHGLSGYTGRTYTTQASMDQELARVRRQGYAIDDVEFEEGVRCVGAPIHDHRGQPVAAISISAPVSRMPRAKAAALGRMLRECTMELSRTLGWNAPSRHAPTTMRRPPRIHAGQQRIHSAPE